SGARQTPMPTRSHSCRARCGSLLGCPFAGTEFMDEAVDVLLANALALGFGATVGVNFVPPRATLIVAQGLANQFAHGAALSLRDRLCALEHIWRQGYREGSGVPHGDIV